LKTKDRKLKTELKKLLYILFILLWSINLFAQNVQVKATIDTNIILIGQQTNIHLSVTYPVDSGKVAIIFPNLKDTLDSAVEIVHLSKIDTTIPNKDESTIFKQTQVITITSFDSGYYALPPFKFIINKDTIGTDPLLLEVQTVAVDTSKAIYDVKKPLSEPFSILDWLKDNWIYIVGVLTFIILIIALFYYLKNRKPKEVVKEIIPDIPAHIIALQSLEKLKEQKLWQSGKTKQYHSSISEILRDYIEKRFGVNAMEETTSEILYGLRLQSIPTDLMNELTQTLTLADLVKFAKENPLPNENESSLNKAIDFVSNTKIEEIKPENNQIKNA